jgi:6-phospho-beta-glucosidase
MVVALILQSHKELLMKITIIGGAGVRTPIIVKSIVLRQDSLGLDNLTLLDIDSDRLNMIGELIAPIKESEKTRFKIVLTTDPDVALDKADFVITTFRVGNIEHRVIDEKVALENHVLGQETTGPGGFAMAMRTIPVLVDYIHLMEKLCPDAWLLNFANPSGMLAEVILRKMGWKRGVGICDGPASMQNIAAGFLGISPNELYLDYFGLNHLGWIRSVLYKGKDLLPEFLGIISQDPEQFELPFSSEILKSLNMIPNEYLYYYYSSKISVERILKAEQTRGEQIAELNNKFFTDLKSLMKKKDPAVLEKRYIEYQKARWETYMTIETGKETRSVDLQETNFDKMAEQGYSGVALDIIESINQGKNKILILNVLNKGSIEGMPEDASVEIPVVVGGGLIHPLTVGKIPEHCLGLMNQVKAYERLTIEAASENSYAKALQALTIHPLVQDSNIARRVLDEYIKQHGKFFPKLS